MSRSGPNEESLAKIEVLRATGVEVIEEACRRLAVAVGKLAG